MGKGAPVAQLDKRWSTSLVVPSSIPGSGNLFFRKRGSIVHSLSFSPSCRSDITEMLLKMM